MGSLRTRKKTVDAVNLYIGMSQNKLINAMFFTSIAEAENWLDIHLPD